MIGTLSNSTLTTDQEKYLDYTVTYSDGATIEQYDKLDAGTTETLRVRVEFKADPEELPASASAITLNYASNYVQADTTHAKARNTVSQPASLEIGDTVAYTTTLNGKTLNNWKVFYNDETNNRVYLIYGDYLPKTAIDTSEFSGIDTYSTYGVYGESDRTELISAMTTTSKWESLLTGTLNGTTSVNETTSESIWAMGSPTLDLYVDSWNASYPSNILHISSTASAMADGLTGYYVGTNENPSENSANMSGTEGYNDELYYPHKKSYYSCKGYWLASPSAFGRDYIISVHSDGNIYDNEYLNESQAIRPVICLPSNLF